MSTTPRTVNVKRLRAGDVITPNGNGYPAKTVTRVDIHDVEPGRSPASRQVTIHFTDGSTRTENHGARRTVRRPA